MFKNIKTKNIVRMVYILLVFMLVTSVTFSRYMASLSAGDDVTIATVYADAQSTTGTSLKLDLSDLVISQDKTIDFNIVNFTGTKASDVTLEYEIELVTTGNLPLTYTITPRETATYGTTITNYTFTDDSPVATGGEMVYGELTTHEYTLTIKWDESATDSLLTNEVDAVQVWITASQKTSASEVD